MLLSASISKVDALKSYALTPAATPTQAIRVVSYNMEADINGDTTPLPGFYQVVEGVGEESVQGNVRPIDILGLEETTSNAVTVAPIVTNLNSYYNGAAVYAQSSYQATQSGSNASGNGPNAIVYNSLTLSLLASVGVGTPRGSSNGEYRQVVRYEFQPVGDSGSTGIFYVYVSHMKSGTTSADVTARGEEATIIRNDEATLPGGSSVIYMGDLNSNPPEAEFTNFTAAGQGQAFDPVGFSSSVQYYSESSTDLRYRDDYQLITQSVLNDSGAINYVSGSFHSFGNNGSTPAYGTVNSGSNTSLNSDLVQDGGAFISASTLYADLTTASDHLPVVADYVLTAPSPGTPTIGSFAVSPSVVTSGATITLTASNVTETGGAGAVTAVNFYLETNGVAGLQTGSDVFVGAGAQSGTTWSLSVQTSGLAVGSRTYYAVASDNNGNSSVIASSTLTINPIATVTTIADLSPNPSNSAYAVSFQVTVSSGVPDGETVTLEDATNANAVVGSGTLSTGSAIATIAAGGLSAGLHDIVAVYTGDSTFAGSSSTAITQSVTDAAAPTLTGSIVGTGAVQRSTISSITLMFGEAVNFSAASFTLEQSQDDSTWTDVSAGVTATNPSGDHETWVISCNAGGSVDRTANQPTPMGLFANGIYQLTLHGANITDTGTGTAYYDGGGDQAVSFAYGNAGVTKDAFAVLFGNLQGTGVVSGADYTEFKNAFLSDTYDSALDWRGTESAFGSVSGVDYTFFKRSFLGAGYSFS